MKELKTTNGMTAGRGLPILEDWDSSIRLCAITTENNPLVGRNHVPQERNRYGYQRQRRFGSAGG